MRAGSAKGGEGKGEFTHGVSRITSETGEPFILNECGPASRNQEEGEQRGRYAVG